MAKDLKLEYAVVQGFGDFAFDMLRYDHCFPAAEEQSPLLEQHFNRGNRFVIVARYTTQPGGWTPDRWKSFCWRFCDTFRHYEDARDYVQRETARMKLAQEDVK